MSRFVPALERESTAEAETRRAGFDLAALVSPGDVVLLFGDLGSGKTVFVRGLAEGLGADPREVASPTFALVHEYGPPGRDPLLFHADFYRLASAGPGAALEDLGLDDARTGRAVLAVEWPRPPLTESPAWRVRILETGPTSRRIRVTRD